MSFIRKEAAPNGTTSLCQLNLVSQILLANLAGPLRNAGDGDSCTPVRGRLLNRTPHLSEFKAAAVAIFSVESGLSDMIYSHLVSHPDHLTSYCNNQKHRNRLL